MSGRPKWLWRIEIQLFKGLQAASLTTGLHIKAAVGKVPRLFLKETHLLILLRLLEG